MTAELFNTDVNMDGLLEVLGKNLYSSPNVAIRELVQNAHDACVRRQIEEKRESSEQSYSIRLIPDYSNKRLTIIDNGSGLTFDEIKTYLATIGSGYTRVLRDSTKTEEMIGYFGLGFLSAYVVADRVSVVTTSYQTSNETYRFVSKGGKTFSIAPVDESRDVGTKVVLELSEEFHSLSDISLLEGLLTKYCSLIQIPIYLGENDKPVNELEVPWRKEYGSDVRKNRDNLRFAQIFEDIFEPICTIEIPKDNPLGLNGLIWLQDSSGYSTSDYRNVCVFVRNMFITHEGRELLPLWAGFVGCVLESNQLIPTASREDLQKTDYYYQVQEFLAVTLISGLKNIAANQPENWRRILTRHNQALIGASVTDDDLFLLLKGSLKLPTSSGEISVEKLLKLSDNKFYLQLEDRNNYEQILFKANNIPVIYGYLFAVSSFCNKYAQYYQKELVNLGTEEGKKKLFKLENIEPEIQSKLEALFKESGESLFFTHIEPKEIPLIIVEDKDAALKKRLEEDDKSKKIGSAALALAQIYTDTIDEENQRDVFVNLGSPLISHLLELETDKAKVLAELIRSFTVILCHDAIDDDCDFQAELSKFNRSLLEILG